jgi:hypothetical protein
VTNASSCDTHESFHLINAVPRLEHQITYLLAMWNTAMRRLAIGLNSKRSIYTSHTPIIREAILGSMLSFVIIVTLEQYHTWYIR